MDAAAERTLDGIQARGEVYFLRGFVTVLILLIVLVGVAERSYLTKRDAARSLFEKLTLTQIAVEARQHIRKIEFGIKNGRELEQFYNMNGILRDIQRGSSYIAGVYVVSRQDILLYSLNTSHGDTTGLLRPGNLTFDDETVYQMSDAMGYYDLFLPVYDANGRDIAFIIIRLDEDVVYFSTRGLVEQEYMQSIVVVLLLLGIGIIMTIKLKPRSGGTVLLIFLLGFSCLSLDLILAYSRFRGIAESATIQSVNRIAQLLQSDVDVIRTMGIPPDMIHDQNSWLRQSVLGLPMIHHGVLDSNMRITLTASRAYFNRFSMDLLRSYAAAYAVLFIAAAAAAALLRIRKRMLNNKAVN